MASYYATLFHKGVITGDLIEACGTFNNIVIDGRYSMDRAIEIARDILKKECIFKNTEYLGFKIEKCHRAWDYKNPLIIDVKK